VFIYTECSVKSVHDTLNLKSHKYLCITTYQPKTESNPNTNPNPNPTTGQHAIVMHSTKYSHMSYVSREIHMRHVVAPSVRLRVVNVTLMPCQTGWLLTDA